MSRSATIDVSVSKLEGEKVKEDSRSEDLMHFHGDRQVFDSNDSLASLNRRVEKLSPWRKQAYFFFIQPTGIYARAFAVLSWIFLAGYSVIFLVETVPGTPLFEESDDRLTIAFSETIMFPFETLITGWWIIEFLGKFYGWPNRTGFFTRTFNLIDLLSILPYFMLFSTNAAVVSTAKFLRICRLAKIIQLARYSAGVKIGMRALYRSIDAIMTLFAFILIALFVSSSFMYWVERGQWNQDLEQWDVTPGRRANFQSIPEGFYWAIVTLATVGYGDVVPLTTWGKLIAGLTMFVSIMTIALPTSIIAANFLAEWQINQRNEMQKKMRKYNQKSEKSSDKSSNAATPNPGSSKAIKEQNTIIMTSIAEIQEKLNDINPPQYFQKYKEAKAKLERDVVTISKLNNTIEQLKHEIKHLKSRSKYARSGHQSSPENDGDHDDDSSSSSPTKLERLRNFVSATKWSTKHHDDHVKTLNDVKE